MSIVETGLLCIALGNKIGKMEEEKTPQSAIEASKAMGQLVLSNNKAPSKQTNTVVLEDCRRLRAALKKLNPTQYTFTDDAWKGFKQYWALYAFLLQNLKIVKTSAVEKDVQQASTDVSFARRELQKYAKFLPDGFDDRKKVNNFILKGICLDTTSASFNSGTDDCGICIQKLNAHWCRLVCGHGFHHHCILKWIDSSIDAPATCPSCRSTVFRASPVVGSKRARESSSA